MKRYPTQNFTVVALSNAQWVLRAHIQIQNTDFFFLRAKFNYKHIICYLFFTKRAEQFTESRSSTFLFVLMKREVKTNHNDKMERVKSFLAGYYRWGEHGGLGRWPSGWRAGLWIERSGLEPFCVVRHSSHSASLHPSLLRILLKLEPLN